MSPIKYRHGNCINIFADHEIYDLTPEEQVVMDGPAEEHVKDAARTLSRYVDALGIRQISQTSNWDRDRLDLVLCGYAEHATVPVINLESLQEHPCQAIADVYTMREHLAELAGRKLTLAWSNHPQPTGMGAGHSILTLAAMLGMEVTVAHPLGFELDDEAMQRASQFADSSGGSVRVMNDLAEGARGADVLYARSWGSIKYWDDPERESMIKRSMQSWQIDESLMGQTSDALFMHPLPVRRNVAVTDAVLDGPRSVIYDQAANRVQVQKEVGQHHHDAIASIVGCRMPEDALPDLRVADVVANRHEKSVPQIASKPAGSTKREFPTVQVLPETSRSCRLPACRLRPIGCPRAPVVVGQVPRN